MTKSTHGFSLLEAVLTFSIMGILLALALPNLKDFIARTDESLMQSQLLRAINFAWQESRIRHVPIVLCQSKDKFTCAVMEKAKYWLIFLNAEEDGVLHTNEDRLAIMSFPTSHGRVLWRGFSRRHYLLFSGEDPIHTMNGTFWYCQNTQAFPSWAIILNKTGRLRVVNRNYDGELQDEQGMQLKC